jgi:hypothetical protein
MENTSNAVPSEATKKCPHCHELISKKATRCPHCQADLRSWPARHPVWSTIIFVIVLAWIIGSISPANQTSSTSAADTTSTVPPPSGPVSSFGDGNYIVGTDIVPGTYKSSGEQNCYWARLSGFGGTTSDIIANDNTDYSAVVTIASTDKGFDADHCGTWTKISAPAKATSNAQSVAPSPAPATSNSATTYGQSNVAGGSANQPATSQTANSPAPQATPPNYSTFASTYFYTYAGDPPAYNASPIRVSGEVNGEFLAAGDRGGSSNYIGTADPNAQSTATVMLKIASAADYQKAVAALQYEDLVSVYGYGAPSEYFTSGNGQQILMPVIDVVRMDITGACGPSGCGEDSDTTVFP